MANANTHTKGTPSWARVHLANVPADCAGVKDCPDCKTANAMIALADKREREAQIALAEQQAKALTDAIKGELGGQEPPPPPPPVYL